MSLDEIPEEVRHALSELLKWYPEQNIGDGLRARVYAYIDDLRAVPDDMTTAYMVGYENGLNQGLKRGEPAPTPEPNPEVEK